MTEIAARQPTAGAELIAVLIGEQQFAIDIMAVREIRGWTASTPLPGAPGHVLGMINLRGIVLPVIDLGARLGFGPSAPGPSSVVVVASILGQQVGLLVDAVCDILALSESAVQPPPKVGDDVNRFVRGVMTTERGIITLLSLEAVLPREVLAEAA